jgi:hypothetical protein
MQIIRQNELSWLASVVHGLQKFYDGGFVLCRHCRRFAEMPVEGWSAYIDIGVILHRNFFSGLVKRKVWNTPLWNTRVWRCCARSGLEHAAEPRMAGKVGANGSANPEIEMLRVCQ